MSKINKTVAEWKKQLTPEQYHVLRDKGTEPPFSGQYENCKDKGIYHCAACGAALFHSDNKYDSGTGWPSFTQPYHSAVVDEHEDSSLCGQSRTEVVCHQCDGHLGHVFADGPAPRGQRYCINSLALTLKKLQ